MQNPTTVAQPVAQEHPSHRPLVIGVGVCAALLGLAMLAYLWLGGREPVSAGPLQIGIVQNVQLLDGAVEGFKLGMTDLGYEEGTDVVYEYYNVNGNVDEAKRVAREFAEEGKDLILAVTSTVTPAVWQTLQDLGVDIPIVFTNGTSFDYDGFIDSYQSSGKNLTGIIPDDFDVTIKKLEFLKQIQPEAKRFGVFYSNVGPGGKLVERLQAQKDALGLDMIAVKIDSVGPASPPELQAKADAVQRGDIDAIMTLPDSVVNFRDNPLILIALGKRIGAPVYALNHSIVQQGGILAYNEDHIATGKQAAVMANKILTGTPAIQIPIEKSGKNFLSVNLKAAKELGLTVPDSLIYNADEVIPAE